MSWVLDRLTEPWQTAFVARAGVTLILVGFVGGVLGVFVIVRGLAFTGEAFAHTVFPGAVLAAAAGGSILLGSLVAGLVAAAAIALASRSARTSDETAVGVVFTGTFALGAMLYGALGPFDRDITSYLFGSLLGVSRGDLVMIGGTCLAVGLVLASFRRDLVSSSFDRASAEAAGVRVARVDAVLLVVLTLTVVVTVQAIGNVLMVALLVTPAAAARLLTRRLASTVALAAGLGVLAGLTGLYVSYYAGIATGGAVVLSASALLAVALLTSPRSGLPAAVRRIRSAPLARTLP